MPFTFSIRQDLIFLLLHLPCFTRYTAFILLYPMGLAGESESIDSHLSGFSNCFNKNYDLSSPLFWKSVFYAIWTGSVLEVLIAYFDAVWLMYQALPLIKTKNLYAYFFAGLPITYYNFVKVCILCFYPTSMIRTYSVRFELCITCFCSYVEILVIVKQGLILQNCVPVVGESRELYFHMGIWNLFHFLCLSWFP